MILEAVDGATSRHTCAKLESAEPPAMSGGAAELFDLLRGDCHSHSDWSDGGSPIREMAEAARDLGHGTGR